LTGSVQRSDSNVADVSRAPQSVRLLPAHSER
jgi:hypothetical protein